MHSVALLVRPFEVLAERLNGLGHHVVLLSHPHGDAYGVAVIDRILRLTYAPHYACDVEANLGGGVHPTALADIVDWTDLVTACARLEALAPQTPAPTRPQPMLRLVSG